MDPSSNASPKIRQPGVYLNQKKKKVVVKIVYDNCTEITVKYTPNSVYFHCKDGDKTDREFTLTFKQEIVPEDASYTVNSKKVKIFLKKKQENFGFWPKLFSDEERPAWLKTDLPEEEPSSASEDDDPEGLGEATGDLSLDGKKQKKDKKKKKDKGEKKDKEGKKDKGEKKDKEGEKDKE